MIYPNILSAIRPVAHKDEIPVPKFTDLLKIDDKRSFHLILMKKMRGLTFLQHLVKTLQNHLYLHSLN